MATLLKLLVLFASPYVVITLVNWLFALSLNYGIENYFKVLMISIVLEGIGCLITSIGSHHERKNRN